MSKNVKIEGYKLQIAREQKIQVPIGAKILKVLEDGTLTLYCVIDASETSKRWLHIHIIEGSERIPHDLDHYCDYLDSIASSGIMYHIFKDNR